MKSFVKVRRLRLCLCHSLTPFSVLKKCLCLLRAVSGIFGTNFPEGWLGAESSGTRSRRWSTA